MPHIKKQAVQFGAGNIGRGFVGVLLAQAGYQVTFVDVVEPLVSRINQDGRYTVTELEPGQPDTVITVEQIRALNAGDAEAVSRAISQADIVTTAVGPSILAKIAPLIAGGLQQRLTQPEAGPLNVIACENLINNSHILRSHVLESLSPTETEQISNQVGFPRCVVDKVVTTRSDVDQGDDLLGIVAEKYGMLIVDRTGFVGQPPAIDGLKLTDSLDGYVEQKIFTLNTGHAITAYLGYQRGYEYIYQALQDPDIRSIVVGALDECSQMLIQRHGISAAEQLQYVAMVLGRFDDDTIPDPVVRVGREPKRKLARGDRLIQPALLALEMEVPPDNLVSGIVAALHYDHPDDPQAIELSHLRASHDLDWVLSEVCGLAPDSPLARLIKADETARHFK